MGFTFHETMRGTYRPLAHPEQVRTILFEVDASAASVTRFLRDRTTEIYGQVTMAGVAAGKPLAGTLVIDPLVGRKLLYEFSFTGEDGATYRFSGQKSVSPLSPIASMTTLHGAVWREEQAIGEARLRFDLRELPGFLRSWSWQ